MSLSSYVNKVLPTEYLILGVQLKPFCLGHYLLMEKYDCAFVSEEKQNGDMDDLLLGLLICSRTYEEFSEFIQDSETFNEWCNKWGKAVIELTKDSEFNLIATFKRFQAYLKEGMEIPQYWIEKEDESDRGDSGTHWTQNLLYVLIKELGYNRSQALNLPLSNVFADYFKWLEANGTITIMSEEETELIAGGQNVFGS